MAGPIVCLLPARNAAAHLRDWLASVEVLADAVVALDDGSTDDTGEILRGAPIVAEVLTNPRRETVAGWDDGANRARLLRAAGSLEPAWIMQVDADERLPADDADELRTFLGTSADPTFAYSFRVYRMVGDLDHFDADHDQWVARCFAFDPAFRLPVGLQHIVPVPTVFEARRRLRTTFRIQHLSGLTPADRRAQHAKYRVVDPDGTFQPSYEHLLREPVQVRRWALRSPALAPLAYAPAPPRDGGRLAVFVPDRAQAASLDLDPCDDVEVVVTDAAGIDVACCAHEYVVAPAGAPGPGYGAALLRAHRLGYAMAGGVVRTDATTASGWAAYFLEHFAAIPGTASGRLHAPPAECSYARDAWTELPTNAARFARGYSAYRASDAVSVVPCPCRSPLGLARRSWARGRARERGAPVRTMARAWRGAADELRRPLRRAGAWIAFGAAVEWLGAGYAAARRRAARR